MASDIFTILGFKVQALMAGLSGGAVRAVLNKDRSVEAMAGSVVIGGLAANYLVPLVSPVVGTSELTGAFIVGLVGVPLCELIIRQVISKISTKGRLG